MINVAFDISFLAAPGVGSTHEDVWNYAYRIKEWTEYLENKNFSFFTLHSSDEIHHALFNAGLHMHCNHIYELGSKGHNLISDVNRFFNSFLSKLTPLKSVHGIRKIEWKSINIEPKMDQDGMSQDIQKFHEEAIVVIGFLNKYDEDRLSHVLVIPNKLDSSIRIKVEDVTFEVKKNSVLNLPKNETSLLESTVFVCKDFKELIAHVDAEQVLINASDDKEVELAVKIALYRHNIENGESADWNDIKTPFIGCEFRKSCRKFIKSGFLRTGEIIRSVVDVVNDINPDSIHPWKSKNGNRSQRCEKNYSAWRYNINMKTGARMHFWRGPNGQIELGCVQDHDTKFFPDLTTQH